MKFLLAQLNATVGDIAGNAQLILNAYHEGVQEGLDLVVCPELMLTGYPPRDLLLKPKFVDENLAALQRLAAQTEGTGLLVGFVSRNDSGEGRELYNSVALLHEGNIKDIRHKTLLPTYDVFDEERYFEPALANEPIFFKKHTLGVTICEDAWNDEDFGVHGRYMTNPLEQLARKGCDFLINVSASPWFLGKNRVRQSLLSSQAKRLGTALLYCNMVGGNDELVFDGGSLVVGADGDIKLEGKLFQSQNLIVNPAVFTLEAKKNHALIDEEKIFKALSLGVKDYVEKCGFKSVLLGLSGGIDSALTAVVAVDALGASNVRGVAMPSEFSSQGSKDDARELADHLGIQYDEIPIQSGFESIKQSLSPVFLGLKDDVAEENMQARLRGVILMGMSNKFGSLLLTTGNKSELAVGYCTLYGDMCGGLAVLSDLPKTMVYRLSEWVNRHQVVIPVSTLTKPPSAELRPDQTDQDSLPDYEILDAILQAYVVDHRSAGEIVSMGYDQAIVARIIRLIDLNEYKRRQSAPGLKVTTRAFGMGRRVPIAQRYRDKP
ncbi:MAG TPA: NAD+ synthase [Verrucomicrobiales bacterium]|nr:NAD+ synthase [Verrucomicrobiales bacterium]